MRIKINKGLDISLKGGLTDYAPARTVMPSVCAVTPDDFPGFVPKPAVREGDSVKVGSAVLFDKLHPEVKLVSPMSGKVKAIVRGERRKIERVVIEADGTDEVLRYDVSKPSVQLLAEAGLLARMRRRPFDIVPDPAVRPRDIFVTAFDSAPLAMPLTAQLGPDAPAVLARAVKALSTMTDGKVYISHNADWTLGDIPGAEMVEVTGKHPAGNVGVQIANIAPVNKGDNLWALDVATLYKIGRLLADGVYDPATVVAVVGPRVLNPLAIKTIEGAPIADLTAGNIDTSHGTLRVISGNVLTGTAVSTADDAFLRYPYRQITVIDEGDHADEFLGWASLSPSKLSASRALPFSRLRKAFSPDARIQGGQRAMIMSGQYDKMVPMDIMTEYLLKAIIARNIDDMEALGIYEIAPEDVALAEFADTSKLPLQKIVRDGLDYLRKEIE